VFWILVSHIGSTKESLVKLEVDPEKKVRYDPTKWNYNARDNSQVLSWRGDQRGWKRWRETVVFLLAEKNTDVDGKLEDVKQQVVDVQKSLNHEELDAVNTDPRLVTKIVIIVGKLGSWNVKKFQPIWK
jgi:hypothetical protein